MGKAERVSTGTEEPCPSPLTRSLLDRGILSTDPTHALSITPKCHPDSGMSAWYRRSDGCVLLVCIACGAGVGWLQLAQDVPS